MIATKRKPWLPSTRLPEREATAADALTVQTSAQWIRPEKNYSSDIELPTLQRQNTFRLSSNMVTGPSLTRLTFIVA